jgi:hypothetical protein
VIHETWTIRCINTCGGMLSAANIAPFRQQD